MNILFVSYEFPGFSPFGGIGTYLQHVALSLTKKGVSVFIICANTQNEFKDVKKSNLQIFSVPCSNRDEFPNSALDVYNKFFENKITIDVMESPEFGADAFEIKKQHPHIRLIVKFHTPSFLVKKLNNHYRQNNFKERLKRFFKLKQYNKTQDKEYQITKIADALISPSVSLGDIISEEWGIQREQIKTIPYPFYLTDNFLKIPYKEVDANPLIVTFIGRLEARKGIVNLTAAIKNIISERDDIIFRFIGRSVKLKNGLMADQYIKKVLKQEKNFEFIGTVPLEEVPKWLEQTNACIFPSLWENFPNVCLEAMAAGRGIIASAEGGMKDMLEDIEGGILVSPFKPDEIKNAILRFADNRNLCLEMGLKARKKVEDYYAQQVIDNLISHYRSIAQIKNTSVNG